MDIQRLLYMGTGVFLRFVVPDSNQPDNWRTVLVLTKGFNRRSQGERTLGTGSEVLLDIADLTGGLPAILRLENLHVELEGQMYSVGKVPTVASNEAQVFNLTCKIRTLRGRFDTTK